MQIKSQVSVPFAVLTLYNLTSPSELATACLVTPREHERKWTCRLEAIITSPALNGLSLLIYF